MEISKQEPGPTEGAFAHETPRTCLRFMTLEDVKSAYQEVGALLLPEDGPSVLKNFLTNLHARMLLAFEKENDRRVGDISFGHFKQDGRIYFGIDIKEPYQNLGYGTELTAAGIEYARMHYRHLMDELLLTVDIENTRAIHVYEKCGYRHVAIQPFTGKDGQERSEHVMSIML